MTVTNRISVFGNGGVLGADGRVHEAVAVADGRVAALGADALDLGPVTVDLGGGLLLPAFRDGHSHPLWGGIDQNRLPLAGLRSVEAIVDAVAEYAGANPALSWIIGGPYDPAALPYGRGDATWLDRATERPVALFAADYHTAWVNSAALTVAGIDADTPDPDLGEIIRRSDGTPCGMLVEFGALELIEAHFPEATAAERAAGLATGLEHFSRLGVVWAQDAAVTVADGETYLAAAQAGILPVRVNLAWRAEPDKWRADRERFSRLAAEIAAEAACTDQLTAATVKFFADGVIEQGTGALLEPYEDEPHSCGLPNWSPEALAEAVLAFAADGHQIHIHAIGDGGVRMALDAIDQARSVLGPLRRPVIAHTQLVDPADRPRFAQLGVIANFEPLWARLDADMTELTIPRLGPHRSALQYPIASLHRSGAAVSFGSDWPVSSANPLEGLAVAVTRQTPDGEPVGGWLPEERLPILEAIGAYTAGSAHQAFDDDRGTIAPGTVADFTLVEADITAMAGAEIADVATTGVWMAGREVWRS